MKSNTQLQKEVEDELNWSPMLDSAEIGVTSKEGVITLTGVVDSYSKKLAAENAAKRVMGVSAIAQEITIQYGDYGTKIDIEIAACVLNAFKFNSEVPANKVTATVERGFVTLSGQTDWNFQKEAAEEAIEFLAGVKGVYNNIVVKSPTSYPFEKHVVEVALDWNAFIDIGVSLFHASGQDITLEEFVEWGFKNDKAGRVAWSAPGAWKVENDQVITYED